MSFEVSRRPSNEPSRARFLSNNSYTRPTNGSVTTEHNLESPSHKWCKKPFTGYGTTNYKEIVNSESTMSALCDYNGLNGVVNNGLSNDVIPPPAIFTSSPAKSKPKVTTTV